MKLTKHEYVALEIFKHKDLTVDEAWVKASEFLAKGDAPQANPSLINQTPKAGTIHGVDLNTLYLECIPQGGRDLAIGQVWCNWYRGYTKSIKQEDITSIKYSSIHQKDNVVASIVPSDNLDTNKIFLAQGWQWELMEDGESTEDCKRRVLKERKRLKRLEIFQSTPFETSDKLADIDLTIRTTNVLKSLGVNTYADLLQRSSDNLIKEVNFGKRCLEEISRVLSRYNLYLGMLKTSD